MPVCHVILLGDHAVFQGDLRVWLMPCNRVSMIITSIPVQGSDVPFRVAPWLRQFVRHGRRHPVQPKMLLNSMLNTVVETKIHGKSTEALGRPKVCDVQIKIHGISTDDFN